MRFPLVLVVGATLLGHAPIQCARDPEPDLREYETPAEALYKLAQRFEASGDRDAWRRTLEYVVERYPNDRYAKMAQEDLEKSGASGDGDGGE